MDAAIATPMRADRARTGILSANVVGLYLLLGVLGVIPLVFLTPPFQVSDEPVHFYRAWQLSEPGDPRIVRDGMAGAMLPVSLPLLAARFMYPDRFVLATNGLPQLPEGPWRETYQGLSIPLEPDRREFVEFSATAFSSPLAYVPQIATIFVGRALGLGPLGLMFATRLVNGLVALLVTAAAIRILPFGKMALLVVGLLPMMLFEFASVSPDALVLSTALLFTAVAARARFRGRWDGSDVVLACIGGMVFCSLKPVFAPLLLMALPGAIGSGRAGRVIAVHALLVVLVAGSTVLWLANNPATGVTPPAGVNMPRQLAGIVSDPAGFIKVLVRSIVTAGPTWGRGLIGILGWISIQLPKPMYLMAAIVLPVSLLMRAAGTPRIGPIEVVWQLMLMGSSALLVLVAMYLFATPVGLDTIEGVQGRYFLPLTGLMIVTLCGILPRWPTKAAPSVTLGVLFIVTAEIVLTSVVIVQMYQVF